MSNFQFDFQLRCNILFRGKRTDNNEWVEGRAFAEAIVPITQPFFIDVNTHKIDDDNITCFRVIPETIGQFTGLFDVKGEKIFEGNIVNCKTADYCFNGFVVKWCQEQCRFIIANDNNTEIKSFPMDESFEYEVIGNIHDDPELLGGDKE